MIVKAYDELEHGAIYYVPTPADADFLCKSVTAVGPSNVGENNEHYRIHNWPISNSDSMITVGDDRDLKRKFTDGFFTSEKECKLFSAYRQRDHILRKLELVMGRIAHTKAMTDDEDT